MLNPSACNVSQKCANLIVRFGAGTEHDWTWLQHLPIATKLTEQLYCLHLDRRYWQVWPSATSYWNSLQWAQMYNEPKV